MHDPARDMFAISIIIGAVSVLLVTWKYGYKIDDFSHWCARRFKWWPKWPRSNGMHGPTGVIIPFDAGSGDDSD